MNFFGLSHKLLYLFLLLLQFIIYNFFKQNLTVPKIKDLVKKPEEQYKNIYNSLSQSKKEKEEKKTNMQTELKNYIMQLSKNKSSIQKKEPEILSNNMFQNSNNYSNF